MVGSDEAGKGGECLEADHEIIELSAEINPSNRMKGIAIYARDHSIRYCPHAVTSCVEAFYCHLV